MVVKVLVFPAASLAFTVKELSPNMRGTSVNVNLLTVSAVIDIPVCCNVTVAFASVCPISLTLS